jgi:hypothetical protein
LLALFVPHTAIAFQYPAEDWNKVRFFLS